MKAQRQRSVPRQTPDVSSQAAAAQRRSAEPAAAPAEETPEQVSSQAWFISWMWWELEPEIKAHHARTLPAPAA